MAIPQRMSFGQLQQVAGAESRIVGERAAAMRRSDDGDHWGESCV